MHERLKQIKERLAAATPLTFRPLGQVRPDEAARVSAFIAHAPADIAWLIELVEDCSDWMDP